MRVQVHGQTCGGQKVTPSVSTSSSETGSPLPEVLELACDFRGPACPLAPQCQGQEEHGWPHSALTWMVLAYVANMFTSELPPQCHNSYGVCIR